MIMFSDQETAILWIAKLGAIGILISCTEYIAEPRHMKSDGLMSWNVSRLRRFWLAGGPTSVVLDMVLRYPRVLGVIALRALIACIILLGPPGLVTNPWIIISAVLLSWLFVLRSAYGQDGSDQMLWIIFSGLALVSIMPTPLVKSAYLWFIALQSCLAYCVAGVAKASAGGWRDGSYLIAICGTHTYGHAVLADLLRRRPMLAKFLARSLIIWECSFPLVLVTPTPLTLAIIGSGVFFHLINAYFMGLNVFFWAFIATYPAVLYSMQMRGW